MAVVPRDATSLVWIINALRHHAAKARFSTGEMEVIVNNNVKSLAQLAFIISPPGTAPNNDVIKSWCDIGYNDVVETHYLSGTHVGSNKHKN